jgi:hypothetical protein
MRISVSKGLTQLGIPLIQRGHSYDVSIILLDDACPWMEKAFRSLNPHYVRTVEEGEAILNLYKELIGESSSTNDR